MRALGVDGCRTVWVGIVLDDGQPPRPLDPARLKKGIAYQPGVGMDPEAGPGLRRPGLAPVRDYHATPAGDHLAEWMTWAMGC